MKNVYTLAALLCMATGPIAAQITINDFPEAGDTIRFAVANPGFGFDAGDPGQNQTWNFSNLNPTSTYLDEFVNTSSTEITYSIVFGLPFSPNYAQIAKSDPFPIPLPSQLGVSLEDVFNFYNRNNSAFKQTGFGASVNGFPIPIPYNDGVDELVPLPLNFNGTGSSSYNYEIQIPSLGFYGRVATRNNLADGTGTLILPSGTFNNVIRLKSTLVYRDSIFVDQLGFGLNLPQATEIKYKFMAPGYGWPLMEITANSIFGQEIVSRVVYRVIPESNISVPETPITSIQVYPNPAAEILVVNTELNRPENLTYTLSDLQGRVVYRIERDVTVGTAFEFVPLHALNLASGVYSLNITSPNGWNKAMPVMIHQP